MAKKTKIPASKKEQIAKIKKFYQLAVKSGKTGFKTSLTQIAKETGCNSRIVTVFKEMFTSDGKLGVGLPTISNELALKIASKLAKKKLDTSIKIKDDIFNQTEPKIDGDSEYQKNAKAVFDDLSNELHNKFGLETYVIGLDSNEKELDRSVAELNAVSSAISSEFEKANDIVIPNRATSQSLEDLKQHNINVEAATNLKKIQKQLNYDNIVALAKEFNQICVDLGTPEDKIIIEKQDYISHKLRELANLTIELNSTKNSLESTNTLLKIESENLKTLKNRGIFQRIFNAGV